MKKRIAILLLAVLLAASSSTAPLHGRALPALPRRGRCFPICPRTAGPTSTWPTSTGRAW